MNIKKCKYVLYPASLIRGILNGEHPNIWFERVGFRYWNVKSGKSTIANHVKKKDVRFIEELLWQMKFMQKDGQSRPVHVGKYMFKPVGIEGILICDEAILKAPFNRFLDQYQCEGWSVSSAKRLLETWYLENASPEVRKDYDIDIPTVEEVFSQRTLNVFGYYYGGKHEFTSRQFPLFENSDERVKFYKGKTVAWWTRSSVEIGGHICQENWVVEENGSLGTKTAWEQNECALVPILRKKEEGRRN